VYVGIIAYLLSIKDTKEQYEMAAFAWKRLDSMIEAGIGDIATEICEELIKNGLGRKGTSPELKAAAEPVILKIGKKGFSKYSVGDLST
jgi:hypothetical protein